MSAIIKSGENKLPALAEKRRQELEAMREEIDITCQIFRMDDYDAKHLARAVFLARVSNGLVPKAFEGDVNSIYIMSKKADQMKVDIIEVLQGGYFVHGKWGWSAEFMVNRVLGIGFFAKIEYKSGGDLKDGSAWMQAVGVYPDGTKAEGTAVSLKMAADEGWSTKNGSKWKTMPALMLRKRAQTFMIREFAPHCFSGETRTHDELEDVAMQAHRTETGAPATVLDVGQQTNAAAVMETIVREERKAIEEQQRLDVLDRIEKKIAEKYKTGDQLLELEGKLGMGLGAVAELPIEQLMAVWEVVK